MRPGTRGVFGVLKIRSEEVTRAHSKLLEETLISIERRGQGGMHACKYSEEYREPYGTNHSTEFIIHSLATAAQAYKLGPSEPAQYALEGSIAVAGAGVSWLKDNLRIIDSPEESATLAASVDSTGGLQGPPHDVNLSWAQHMHHDLNTNQSQGRQGHCS